MLIYVCMTNGNLASHLYSMFRTYFYYILVSVVCLIPTHQELTEDPLMMLVWRCIAAEMLVWCDDVGVMMLVGDVGEVIICS